MGTLNERMLIEALDALESGESIDSILAKYPEDGGDLRPVLETAARLAQIRVAHSLESQSSSKQKFLERAADLRGGAERPKAFAGFFRRFTLSFVPLVMVIVVLTAGILLASRSAVPGDVLYGAKRAAEDLRFSLTGDSQARQTLRSEFEQERIREINTLLREGKSAQVEFGGVIEVMGEESWIVAGIRVHLEAETRIEGESKIGSRAHVEGMTTDGRLTAQAVIVKGNGTDLPDIIPTETIMEPREEVDPSATETPSPTPRPSPTPSETPSPTYTLVPTPSPESSETLSITPEPVDGGGDDDGDGVEEPEGEEEEPEDEEEEPEDEEEEPESEEEEPDGDGSAEEDGESGSEGSDD